MNTLIRYRTVVFTLIFTAPLLLPLSGCGGDSGTSVPPSDELKKSEASYEAEIAKQKAAIKTAK